jgi:multiple sugar transport system ATP-binding protein
VVLNEGRVEQIGSPMELYNDPANLFVAGFIGSPQMNFVDAGSMGEVGAATIGIRPEHIAVSRETGLWQADVVHSEHLGADTILYLDSDKAGLLTVRLFGEQRFTAGDRVFAAPAPDRLYRFAEDGRVIRDGSA